MDIFLNIALSTMGTCQYQLALEHITKAEAMNVDKTPYYYYVKGTYYQRQLDYVNAYSLFSQIPFDCDEFKDAMPGMAETFRKLYKYQEALDVANAGVQRFPDYYKSYSIRGFVYSDKGDYNLAIADFKKAIAINSNAKEAKQGIVWAYCKLKNESETMKLYKQYFQQLESDSRYLQLKAKLLTCFGKHDEAMIVIERILDREPNNAKYQRDRVICLFNQHKYDKCITSGEELINLENKKVAKEMAQLNFHIAVSYLEKDKNYEKYEHHMKVFESEIPIEERNQDYFLEKARRQFEANDRENGIATIEKILKKDPECISAVIMKINYLSLKPDPLSSDEQLFIEQNCQYKENVDQYPENCESQVLSVLASDIYMPNNSNANQNSNQKAYLAQQKQYQQQQNPQSKQLSNNQKFNNNNNNGPLSGFMSNNNNEMSISFDDTDKNDNVKKKPTDKQKIGEGGFSIVYTNYMPDGKLCAFKEFKAQNNEILRIKDEEQAIFTKLKHPNIVKYEGFYSDNIIIMEYCSGKDLFTLLITQNVKVPIKFKYKIILQIAEALNYVHDMNIVHSDIKTKNILLDRPYDAYNWPNAKLCDFGLSINAKDVNKAKGATIYYASPEVFDPNATITSQSDIYSFGMTIFEIISQTIPFKEDAKDFPQSLEMSNFVKNSVKRGIHPTFSDLKYTSDCCLELITLMDKMCVKLPEKRPTIKQVLQELKAIYNKY